MLTYVREFMTLAALATFSLSTVTWLDLLTSAV